ncbi:mucin-5B-like [Ranitomeya variabilis]|uniref:mucin-5B-like n=1 Tax=Ranitomeya variabilis TaxID=490064 RepID=UPI004055ABF8
MQIQLLPKMQLYISMEKSSKEQLQGLCGNFNTKEGDDFTTSGGLVEATASVFANTWKSMANCHDILDWLDDPCSASIENKNYAEFWCSKLENTESPFAKCHSMINPTEYVKRCRYDSCNCKDSEPCMCAALSSYVTACAVKGIILWGWKSGICDKYMTPCPSNQIYLYNLTTYQPTCRSLAAGEKVFASVFKPIDGCGCPEGQYLNEKDQCVHISKCSCYHHDTYLKPQKIFITENRHCICQNGNLVCADQVNKTCSGGKVYFDCNKSQTLLRGAPVRKSCKTLSIDYFQTECISGCVCPNGLLDDGVGGCVPEDRCPCVHNKDIYPHGTQVEVDCKRCLCQRGRWTCTNTVCYGTCTIYGDGHYITFDNKFYDFDGNCEFVAAQDYCEADGSGGSFRVLTENIPCGTTGVTCSKSMTVFLGNTMLKLSEKHVITTTQPGGERVDYLTREVGIYVVIEASNGILLIWDKKTTLFIKVSPAYKGKLCGLCGNFDENSQNDFKTRHMIQVADVLEFGNSWKVDPSCPDAIDVLNPCSQNPHRRSWAEKQCGLIKSHVFTPCHCKVDPKPFYEACVNDACSCDTGGDCECFCTAVAAYAQECTKAEACVYWRTPDICPIFCDYYNPTDECEWHYHPCGNHNIQTCRSINNVYTNVTITYLEGCYPTCPKNRPIFDETNKKCVTREECGCYSNNVHYKSGEEVPQHKECYECVCSSNGNIDCKKQEISSCSSTSSITTTSITPTVSPTAATKAQNCRPICSWSEWISASYPKYENEGDDETYHNIRQAGFDICERPLHISCRAEHWPDKALHELGQKVTCDVSNGLICNNKEQNGIHLCYNYEVQVYCCRLPEMCFHTTPQISKLTPSTPIITTVTSAGTNTTTRRTSTKTTKFQETSSHSSRSTPVTSTRVTTSPTTTFGINIKTPGSAFMTTVNSQNVHIHSTKTITKATTRTFPPSTSKAGTKNTKPKSTPPSTTEAPSTTIVSSPTTTSITILPSPFLTSSSFMPLTTATSPPTTSSVVISTPKQMVTSKGSVISITSSIPKTSTHTASKSVIPSSTSSSTTRILPTTNTTSFTTITNKDTSTASVSTRNIEVTTIASLTTSTTSKGTYTPPKPISATSEATSSSSSQANTFTSTAISVTSTSTTQETTTYIRNSSTPFMSTQPIATTKTTATSSSTIPTKPITYQDTEITATSTSKAMSGPTTETTSAGSSQTTTAESMTQMSSTIPVQSAGDYMQNTVPSLPETTTSSLTTASQLKTTMAMTSSTGLTITETSPDSSVNGKKISYPPICVCMYNGTPYPPGIEIISKVISETWCHEVVCSMECKIEENDRLCFTPTPASTSMKSTSDMSPSSTSAQMTSTKYSTTHMHTSPIKTTPMVSPTTQKRGCSFEQFREINETWMVKNCTMAKCLENHTVELSELKCEPPPMITCASGKAPIAVSDDNQCCWHWQCDCECSGWGDPHYLTFDGTYYTFQGTCTYTLVEEIEKKNNLSIYIDNYDCGTKDLVSCPRNLIVHYNSQEIQLVVGVSKSIKIQVVVNGEIVGTPYKKYGVKIYINGINYVMEIPELQVNITFNGLSFSINLPYDRFGHNTQGQCGTCTNNRTDDCRTKSGNIISTCEIMAGSWIIEDLRKPKCDQINTTAPPKVTTQPPTCPPPHLCNLIIGQTFQKCHKTVPPNHYYEACVYDSCHVSGAEIECSSLQHYAHLCGEKGICIDWRSQVPECTLPCLSPKVYNACGSAIQRTCETTQIEDLIMKDDRRLVEGCFCPRGTIRFSPAVDICVDTCGCVSPDDVPRKFGEKFQLGCQDCICREGGSGITCQKHMCENIPTVHCNLQGFFPGVQISPTDPCCQETVCKCNISRCETTSPTCELGYEAVGSIQDGHCCIQYQCVAKNVCVHRNAEYMPGAQVYTDNCQSCVCTESANRTTGPIIQCTDILHNAPCPLGFALKKGTKHCCGGCEQTHCVLSLNASSSSYRLIKPDEIIISDNKCTEYRCSVINNQFITSSSHFSCPDFNEDDCTPGTIKLLPNGCCKVCVKKTASCKLFEYYDHLSYNNCRTADMVKMSRCVGSCKTFSTYSSSAKAMSHKCACCQEVQTRQKHVTLQCSDGSQVEQEYIAVEKCDCVNTACEPMKAEEEEMILA